MWDASQKQCIFLTFNFLFLLPPPLIFLRLNNKAEKTTILPLSATHSDLLCRTPSLYLRLGFEKAGAQIAESLNMWRQIWDGVLRSRPPTTITLTDNELKLTSRTFDFHASQHILMHSAKPAVCQWWLIKSVHAEWRFKCVFKCVACTH